MIPVTPVAEPAGFDRKVRRRGRSAIDQLVGRPRSEPGAGRRFRKCADREEDIPPDRFPPYWRDALDDMLDGYRRLCAYLALHIAHGTGSPSVDHVVPKSQSWDRVYEWANYRLCAARINARKGILRDVLDPFEIGDGWFAMEFVGFQLLAGPDTPAAQVEAVRNTIERLGLNAADCCRARGAYVTEYEQRHIDFDYLRRRAPFVAAELRRQGLLRPEDA